MRCPGAVGNIQRKPLKKERSVFPDQIRLYHVHRVVFASKLMSDLMIIRGPDISPLSGDIEVPQQIKSSGSYLILSQISNVSY